MPSSLTHRRDPTVVGPLEALLDAARAHGEEDHEVGDLQQMLFKAWGMLTPRQRRELYGEFRELVDEWGTSEGERER